MRTTLLILINIFLAQFSYGQAFTQLNNSGQGAQLNYQIMPEDNKIDGDPYYSKEWQKGLIIRKDGSKLEVDRMNFNTYLDDMVFENNSTLYLMPKSNDIDKLLLGSNQFILTAYNGKMAYFNVLTSGEKLSVLLKYDCKVELGKPSMGYTKGTDDRYVQSKDYFIKSAGGALEKINLKRDKDIIKLMLDKENKIKEYIQNEKLKLKKEEDLISLIDYYNTL